jgi:hypothetical protein
MPGVWIWVVTIFYKNAGLLLNPIARCRAAFYRDERRRKRFIVYYENVSLEIQVSKEAMSQIQVG